MSCSLYLTHTDTARNMARFYSMSLQASLFGEWSLVREWGRIGRGGTVKIDSYGTLSEAEKAYQQLERIRLKHGYISKL